MVIDPLVLPTVTVFQWSRLVYFQAVLHYT